MQSLFDRQGSGVLGDPGDSMILGWLNDVEH